MRQKIIIAIDSFKGCLTSQEANQAAAEGVTACVPDAGVIQIPVSDGGEGWLAALSGNGRSARHDDGARPADASGHCPLSRPQRYGGDRDGTSQWTHTALTRGA